MSLCVWHGTGVPPPCQRGVDTTARGEVHGHLGNRFVHGAEVMGGEFVDGRLEGEFHCWNSEVPGCPVGS